MHIIKQTNPQECGVCVLTMLTNHFYKNKFDKVNILALTPLTNKGMSLLDLEIVGAKVGLELESYQTTWSELFDLKQQQKMVLLIYNDEFTNHFVVANLKNKNELEVYDPRGIKTTYTKEVEMDNFLKIVSLVKKGKNRLPKIDFSKKLWNQFYSPYVLSFFVVGILIFCLNLLISFGMARLFNLIPNNNEWLSLLKISILLVFMICMNFLLRYVEWLLKNWYVKKIYFRSVQEFIWLLHQKKLGFYQTVNKSNFLNFFKYLKEIIVYYADIYVDVSINLIISICSIAIMIFFKWEFIILVLTNFVLNAFLTFLQVNFHRKNIKKIIDKTNKINNQLISFYEDKLENKIYKSNNLHLISYQIVENENLTLKSEHFNFLISNYEQAITNFLTIIMYFIAWFFLHSGNNFSNIFIVISVYSYLNSASNFILNLFLSHKNLKYIKEIVKYLYNNNNDLEKNNIKLDQVNSLKYNNFYFENHLQINFAQSSLIDPFEFLLDKFQINHTYLKDLNLDEYKNKILKINLNDEIDFLQLKNAMHQNEMYYDLFLKFLKKLQLNLALIQSNKNINKEVIAILNLFLVLFITNDHLLFIHNDYGYFSKRYKKYFIKILHFLKEKNKVVYLSKFYEEDYLFDLKVYEKSEF